jgi:hypothetical protein
MLVQVTPAASRSAISSMTCWVKLAGGHRDSPGRLIQNFTAAASSAPGPLAQ